MNLSTIEDIQEQIMKIEIERGHITGTILQKSLLLGEEVGELFKAIREREGMSIHSQSSRYSVEDELSDCFFLLVCLANRYGIDMQIALFNKLKKDENKVYGVNQ
jgi:NTP pyrophosphatase (non-canonical NTP hydrolase)